MIHIEKGPAPAALAQAVREMKTTPDATVGYRNFGGELKQAVKESLVAEQHGLCAYCMRRIGSGRGSSIEHVVAQHGIDGACNLTESLDYGNMLAVCVPKDGVLTCDKSRGNQMLTVNPLDEKTLSGIKYHYSGLISSDDPDVDHDLNAVLNLNDYDAFLPQNRNKVWDSVNRKISEFAKHGSRENKRNKCQKLKDDLLKQEQYAEFIGVILFRLDHFIRKFS